MPDTPLHPDPHKALGQLLATARRTWADHLALAAARRAQRARPTDTEE